MWENGFEIFWSVFMAYYLIQIISYILRHVDVEYYVQIGAQL